MMIVQAWATGTTPLLLHRATEEALAGKTRSNNPGEDDDPRIICERTIYRLDNKQIAIPGAAFARMLREAGGSHKVKGSRKSVKYLVPAAMIVLDDLCGLFLNDRKTPIRDFEIDARPVTIPATKGRIMRYRARLNEWSCPVRLRINQTILDEGMIRRLMVEGLQQIGLGDFRPEKGGPFGTSDLVDWSVISEPKPMSVAQKRAAA
jgi:hypothetical protein